MKKILVTGGAGFLGTNLCKSLLKNACNTIICVDNLYSGNIDNIKELLVNPRFQFIKHDIINPLHIDVDEIYNLACPASLPKYQKSPTFTTKTCVIGITNMLELARVNNAKILHFSTSEIYGNPVEHPQVETYNGNVNTTSIRACYAEGKRCAETLCFGYIREYGVNVKIARIFNTYGPYMSIDDGRVISNFVMQALNNKSITIYGDGTHTRSFCYVDDMIDGLVKLMNIPVSLSGPMNLGNPEEYSIIEIAKMIKQITKSSSEIVFQALPHDDPVKRKPDISFANTVLGWYPQTDLKKGLHLTVDYFLKSKVANNRDNWS